MEPKKKTQRKNRQSNSFRDRTIRCLKEKGFSWPKAERGFRAVFEVMAGAIRRGDLVDLPGIGTIKSVLRNRRSNVKRYFCPLHNVHTGKSPYRLVHPSQHKRRIVFTPDLNLDLTPPPPPLTRAEIAARELATELLGRPVNDWIMAELQKGVDAHPHRSGALLLRLRELKHRGRTFQV